ncbi:TPA: hypothetical protein ACWV5Q_002534 [Salmonella enterica subsp. enterica serovar Muenchen]|nr:hypothetical protein [Salmonella enterica subsp. enterica serovar Muenchen]EIW3593024.1 hypothetical protein [Salmonella enterica]HAF2712996.1 hypothetical protein [Salmonella enterica]
MFNVKRNGASVEITEIPASIPFNTFKNIADETGATETLVCYFKDKTEYEVIIQHTNENMAGTVAWMALEVLGSGEPAMEVRPEYNVSTFFTKSKVIITVTENEIKITGSELEEFLSNIKFLSRGSRIAVAVADAGRNSYEITIKPDLGITNINKVLVGIGMILGKRVIDVTCKERR